MKKIKQIITFCKQVHFKFRWFILPSILSLLAGASEAANVALLLPLAQGLLKGNFAFLAAKPWFQWLSRYIFFAGTSQSFIFGFLISLVFLTAVFKCAFEYLSVLMVSRQIRGFSNNLRKLLYGRFLSFGKLYFDQSSLGVMQQTLIGYTNKIAIDLKDYQQVITWFFQLIVYLGILFYISAKLTFFVFLIFPVLHYSVDWLIKKINKTSLLYADAMAAMSKNAYNILSSIPLVKAYHSEELEKNKFCEMSDRVQALEYSVDKKLNLVPSMQEVFILCMILLLVGAIAFLTHGDKSVQMSSYIVYFYVLKKASNLFRSLNYARSSFASSKGLWAEILTLMDDRGKYYVTEGTREILEFSGEIEIRNMNFAYHSDKPILSGCNFSVKKGQMTALVGETGAGKSTIANLIGRFYEIPAGCIFIDGIDVREFSMESYRKKIAFVHQDALVTNDTFRNNLLYGLTNHIDDSVIVEALKKAHLDEFVLGLPRGLDTPLGDRGVRLSGGERQRLSIARAILKDTEILILDEATSSLDSQTEKFIQSSMEELVKGKTTIVIAHRFSTIKHADKIVVLDKGRVCEVGSLDSLLQKKGKFYELWEAQRFS